MIPRACMPIALLETLCAWEKMLTTLFIFMGYCRWVKTISMLSFYNTLHAMHAHM